MLSADFLSHPQALRWIRVAFEAAPFALSLRDHALGLVWANRAYEKLMGASSSNLAGVHVSDLIAADQRSEAFAAGSALQRGESDEASRQFRYRRADGSTLIADVTLRALRNPDGELQYVLGFVEDVTDREGLARQLDLDQLVATASAQFVNVTPTGVADVTRHTLERLSSYFDCVRADLIDSDAGGGDVRLGSTWAESDFARDNPQVLASVAEIETPSILHDLAEFDSVAVVPIARNGRTTGHLLLSGRDRRLWTAPEMAALEAFANLFAGLHARVEAQIYLDLAFEAAPVGISVRNANSELLAANQAYADFLGYDSPADIVGSHSTGVVASVDTSVASSIPATVDERGTFVVERMEFKRADGSTVIGRVHAKGVAGLGEQQRLILSHVEDLTVTADNEKALERSQRRFRDLVENSPAITMLVSPDMEITYASPSISSIGLDPAGLEGRVISSLPSETAADLASEVELVLESGRPRYFDWAPQGLDGDLWLRVAAMPEADGDGVTGGVIMVAVDDSARRKTEGELIHQAHHDPLTGLANRKALLDHLQAKLEAEPEDHLAVIFLDVDRFKVVNDSLGHGAGDELVRKVAQRLEASVRSGSLVARFGGDEFVIVADGLADKEHILKISQRIHNNLAEPILIGEHELYITVSMGIAFADSKDTEELIANADAAMYAAKEAGRNRTSVHKPSDNQLTGERFRIEAELRRALPRGEFEPFFQAEVDLETGELLGGETLIRWHHPERGLLAAGAFVGIAEDCGLITDIGDWVMRRACEVLRMWQSDPATEHLTVRVNLSANQLSERGVVDRVTRAVDSSGADPAGLCLEITETVLMADAAASLKVLRQLRELGLTLAVDDFGTGYSSLAYLKQFPVDILKIDRSFVDGLPHDSNDVAIVQSIVSLANALGLDLVAEGVENEQQASILHSMGCRRAQGYHFARPISRGDFEQHPLFTAVTRSRR